MAPEPRKAGIPGDYPRFLRELKDRIRAARLKAVLSVNRELIELYWDLGRQVVDRQRQGRWGMAITERLAYDLQAEFPGMACFSVRNIWNMRAFYRAWTGTAPI